MLRRAIRQTVRPKVSDFFQKIPTNRYLFVFSFCKGECSHSHARIMLAGMTTSLAPRILGLALVSVFGTAFVCSGGGCETADESVQESDPLQGMTEEQAAFRLANAALAGTTFRDEREAMIARDLNLALGFAPLSPPPVGAPSEANRSYRNTLKTRVEEKWSATNPKAVAAFQLGVEIQVLRTAKDAGSTDTISSFNLSRDGILQEGRTLGLPEDQLSASIEAYRSSLVAGTASPDEQTLAHSDLVAAIYPRLGVS